MAAQLGATMRSVGVHQGLAPVLDVTRDYRWGRVEETIGEDPYLVATIGTAYVRGLESAGVVATLKHFVGYSAIARGAQLRAGLGGSARARRRVAAAVRDGDPRRRRALGDARLHRDRRRARGRQQHAAHRPVARPVGIRRHRRRGLLRRHVPATLHKVAQTNAAPPHWRLWAGIDVELPTVRCYGAPLVSAVKTGQISEEFVDRAARRVLTQKGQLGLLDPDWSPQAPAMQRPARGNASRRQRIDRTRHVRVARSRSSARRRIDRAGGEQRRAAARPRRRGSRWSARAPTMRSRCWAATRFPATSAWSIRSGRSGFRFRRCSKRLATNYPAPR